MALQVASEPVPQVVGIMTLLTCFFAASGFFRRSRTVVREPSRRLQSFAESMTLPPPTAMMRSALSRGVRSITASTAV